MKPKSTLRPLLNIIAGSSLLAISSASAQTLPNPLSGSVALDVSGGPVTYSGNSTVSGATLSFTTNGTGTRAAILPGSLTGTGSLTFDDPGTLTLTGSSSYSGGTIVRNGTFSVGSTGTLGVNDTTTRRLTVTGDGAWWSMAARQSFRGSGATDNNAMLIGDTAVASGGNLTVQNNGSLTLSQGRFIIGGGQSASASNTAATSVFSQTSGSTTIAANGVTNVGNITPGSLNISGGTFTAGTFNMGVRANSTLTLSGANTVVTLGNLSFGGGGAGDGLVGTSVVANLNGGTLAVSTVTAPAVGNRTHTFNFDGGTLQARGSSATFFSPTLALTAQVKAGGGTIDNNGFNIGIAQALLTDGTGGGMTFKGGGTTTLTGTSTYTGATTVSAGTLLVNGELGNSAVTVDSLATIGGTGTINGSLSFAANSFLQVVDFDDPLAVGGTITFGSGFGIANLLGINWDILDLDTPYTVLSTTQTFGVGDIANFGIGNAVAVGSIGRQAYFTNGSLAVVVIPEPSAALLGGLGLLALLRRRRA
jgi:fibronectin-binding autotransporter adhesin